MAKDPDEHVLGLIASKRGSGPAHLLSADMKVDVILLYDHVKRHSKAQKGGDRKSSVSTQTPTKPRQKKQVRDRVATMLHLSPSTVSSIWSNWRKTKEVPAEGQPGNRTNHQFHYLSTDTENEDEVLRVIRDYLRECHNEKRYVRAPQVRAHLASKGLVPQREADGCSMRTLQRFLRKRGFIVGKKKGSMTVDERIKMVLARRAYRTATEENKCSESPLQRVFLDESYIYQNHKVEETLYDPNDSKDDHKRAKQRGMRHCFIAAIKDDCKDITTCGEMETWLQAGMFKSVCFFPHIMLYIYSIFRCMSRCRKW